MIKLKKRDIEEVHSFAGNATSYVRKQDNEDEDLSLEEQSIMKFHPQIGKWGYSNIDMLGWGDFL